jgi:hypothetical protein
LLGRPANDMHRTVSLVIDRTMKSDPLWVPSHALWRL